MRARVSVEIEWRCEDCGHHHKQIVLITVVDSISGIPPKSDYRLVCMGCGRQSLLQIIFDGMADIASGVPNLLKVSKARNSRTSKYLSNMVRSARYPSLN